MATWMFNQLKEVIMDIRRTTECTWWFVGFHVVPGSNEQETSKPELLLNARTPF